MGYFLQKLAEEVEAKRTLKDRFTGAKNSLSETLGKAKSRAGEMLEGAKSKAGAAASKAKTGLSSAYTAGKGKMKSLGQGIAESRPGQFVKNNPKKVGIGAAGTALALGLYAGRNKIKSLANRGSSDN